MAYSIDLRKKVIKYLEDGNSQRQAAKVFNINLSTVNEWSQKYHKTGNLEVIKPPKSFKKIDPKKLMAFIETHPDAYLSEIALEFNCSAMAVSKALKRLCITRKKRN